MSVVSAVENNNDRILTLLVAVPGSVSQKDLDHGLVLAVRLDHAECLQILIKAGANPCWKDSLGNTLLKSTAEDGKLQLMFSLLEAGCSVNTRNNSGSTALHYAAKSGMDKSVGLLLENGAKIFQDSDGNTPLILAAKNCHRAVNVMKLLIGAKCDLDVQNKDGKTALHYAAHKAIGVELLLAAGANPNIQDHNGNTPMMMAASEGFDNVIKTLVSYNADPDLINSSKRAVVHFLAMKNHWDAIESIAYYHGNVDMIDGNNNIPLWYAVNHNRPEAVKALLRANCDPDPPCGPDGIPLGGIPLKTALEKKLYVIAKLLVLSGCTLGPLYEWLKTMEESRNNTDESHYVFAEEEEEEEVDEEEEEALCWFEDWVYTPHSLKQICRIWIRQHLGQGIVTKGHSLPVPPPIRDYITLKEVEDHHVIGVLL